MDPDIRSIRRILPLVFLTFIWGPVATENDRDFKMCGTWKHGNVSQQLSLDLKTGCDKVIISANKSTLSIQGRITAQCTKSEVRPLNSSQVPSHFCVFWEPILDSLVLELDNVTITLCDSYGIQTNCCTDLSSGSQSKSQDKYGIANGSIHGDLISGNLMSVYEFRGDTINCKEEFCDKATHESRGANMIEDAVMRSKSVGSVDLPCAQSVVLEMKEDFEGVNVTLPAPKSVPKNTIPQLYLPACLKPSKPQTAKVVCTYYKNSNLFQGPLKVLDDVVGISVENEIITNLPEPVKIKFLHSDILENQTAKCVSWDTRRDKKIKWRLEGCQTVHISSKETECFCNHLTYFAILVQVNPTRKLQHLKALTFITAVGCAVSLVSCAVLFVSLCRKRRAKDQSSLVHRGLVVALFFLCLFFILTGSIANLGQETLCQFVGALLHYSLLSTLCWMAVEVFHTFWMIFLVFSPSPKPLIWYLLGFGLPALPVIVLASIGNVYGERMVMPSDDVSKPYRMCWMTESHNALLAHFVINVGLLVAVISSGCVMLFLVVRKIHNRDEWRRNHVAFLSIWGLSCLFGTTWMLIFIEHLSESVVFFFCIINSLQGFFLMLRFYALEQIRKKSKLITDGSSTGSTRQHMLQVQENS
ncbi:adhesion G-protein coupled receptor G5-like [Hoplias malabaricus]|uniref:adhesion G-protein coupled receptor G5-like n=1 Tax=Hoplias malabaricus TaxID=27720 RepID=UPI0034621D1C